VSGITFVVLFVASVFMDNTPNANAVSAARIAVGSLLQALIPEGMIFNSLPEPSPDIMRVLGGTACPPLRWPIWLPRCGT
jgi:hypothetical protein